MSQNQEIIESKLCAYIDGELDADGRTEIEKHLDANPQHRRLLESLKATRDLIKWLPREPAPPELAETLNGQLERSVLLDFDERSLNRNIWPRVLSAAAIVLLTAGLGAAVYFTLPKGQKSATPYASRTESQSPMPDGQMAEPATEPAKPDDALVASTAIEKSTALAAPAAAMKVEADRTPNPELDRLATDVSENGAAIVAVANGTGVVAGQQLQQAHPIPSNAVVMLVQANSTEQATRDVTTYLESQNIRWKPAVLTPAAAAPTSQAGSLGAGGREARESMALARRGAQNEPTTHPDAQANVFAALSQSQNNQSQTMSSRALATTGLYVARMSRQQAINLNYTVGQGKSQRSQLKDLSSQAGQPDSLFPQNGQGQAAPGRVDQKQAQQIMADAAATPAQAPDSQPSRSAMAFAKATTQQGGFGGNRGGGGFGGGAASGAIPAPAPFFGAVTQPAASQPATTEPVDAPVDVVIVVQPETIPQTEPATSQPASATQPAAETRPSQP